MLSIRELIREDVPVINGWRSSEELMSYLGAPYRFIGPDVDYRWFENYLNNRSNTIRCCVCEDGNAKPLCLVTLAGIDWVSRNCELHIMVGNDENRGKGIGSFAVKKMIEHAFLDMNLRRIELTVLEDNARARLLYEKFGFQYEGIKRKAKYKHGRYVDMRLMALLKSDWLAGRGSNNTIS
ncbi:N-acetyltransferase [Collinsella sp. OF03-4AA]|nr:N-acetyltransferase [Collinsella sp. OF03-4AA]